LIGFRVSKTIGWNMYYPDNAAYLAYNNNNYYYTALTRREPATWKSRNCRSKTRVGNALITGDVNIRCRGRVNRFEEEQDFYLHASESWMNERRNRRRQVTDE